MSRPRTGARILVDQLLIQGVNFLYCVPGEAMVPVLDALLDQPGLRPIVNRHESASTFMAGAYARLTGQPGVAFVSRGPGACNAAIGIHHAAQDSLPVVLLVGQSRSTYLDREAFQEIDCRALFGSLAKWVAQVDSAERLPEYLARAFQTAASGRPGPVVLSLPEDMLQAGASAADARCHQAVQSAPSDTQLATLRRLLGRAQRPLVLVGGWGWNAAAAENLVHFAQANALPVAAAFRHQDILDNRHPNYVGDVGLGINPRLAERVRAADLLLVFGGRLDEASTGGYELLQVPVPQQALVHAHAGVDELGRVYQAELLINTGMPQLAARLAMLSPIEDPVWAPELLEARSQYESWQQKPAPAPGATGTLDPWEVLAALRAGLPDDAIVASGAGNFSLWLHRFFPYRAAGTQLAPAGGSMGYAVPAAIAAKLAAPDKTVVCVSGDGDFQMSGQELATACQYRAPVLFLVFNNRMYGTIRMHQERQFPGRVVGTGLDNPDFAQLARAHGAYGASVRDSGQFAAALALALADMRARRQPALIELHCDADRIAPDRRIADLDQRGA